MTKISINVMNDAIALIPYSEIGSEEIFLLHGPVIFDADRQEVQVPFRENLQQIVMIAERTNRQASLEKSLEGETANK